MVRVAQPSGGETTFEKDLPRSPRCIRVSQPSGGKTTFDKELPKSPRTVRVSQPSGGKTTFEEVPFPENRLRVLKPPGGGSSISFGGDDVPSKTASPAPHDSSKSNGIQNGNSHTNGHAPTTNGTCNGTMSNGSMTPNGSSTTASSPGSAKSGDTQNRLFGESNHTTTRDRDSTPTKPTIKSAPKVRDHMRSSIFGEDSNGSGTPSRNGTPNGTVHSSKAKDLPSKVKPEALSSSSQQDIPKTEAPFPDINKTDSKPLDPSPTTISSPPAPTKVPEEAAPKVTVDVPKSCVDKPKPEITISENLVSQNNGTPSISEVGSVKETPEPPKPASAPAAQQPRGRVPPGGHSTALW